MNDLFEAKLRDDLQRGAPLADRMRPRTLGEFVGQEELVGDGKLLRSLIERDQAPSMIFWGPPGTGKTTLARIIADLPAGQAGMTKSVFVQLSATSSGLAELRASIGEARERRKLQGTRTILFVDEIHRWNKAQQDALLPHVENGTVTLIGATTENPSFEVVSALLSRCRVFVLRQLAPEEIGTIIRRALADRKRGIAAEVSVGDETISYLAALSDGDARVALNALEIAVKVGSSGGGVIELKKEAVAAALQKTHLLYDRQGEEHYNIISALHKSIRGSDADAALYWLGRMLEAGEDPLYVARRLIRAASEDIGLADPNALLQAVAAHQAAQAIGLPECGVVLAQATAYLARAPKSNALYQACGEVARVIRENPAEPVPLHIRNAPTKLMKDLGYGRGYVYNPDAEGPVEQEYLPNSLKGKKFIDL